jgi:sugar/nucleoside kinase (ribokinase family)
VPTVAVSVGAAGCVLHAPGVSRHHPTHKAVVLDATGPGEIFILTFVATLTAGVRT